MKKLILLLVCTFFIYSNTVSADEIERDNIRLDDFFEQRDLGINTIVNNKNTIVRNFKCCKDSYYKDVNDKTWVQYAIILKLSVPKKDCYYYDESGDRPFSEFTKKIPVHLIYNTDDLDICINEINKYYYSMENINIDINSIEGYSFNGYVLISENGERSGIADTTVFCKNSSLGDNYYDVYCSKVVYIKPNESIVNIDSKGTEIRVNGISNMLTKERIIVNGENYISENDFQNLYNKYNKSKKSIALRNNEIITYSKIKYVSLRNAINYIWGENSKIFYDTETKEISAYCISESME